MYLGMYDKQDPTSDYSIIRGNLSRNDQNLDGETPRTAAVTDRTAVQSIH